MIPDLADLSRFTFLSVGFWVVVVAVIAFSLVGAVGPVRGKRAARMWVDSSLGLAFLGAGVDVVWALESRELFLFIRAHGVAPLLGLAVLSALLLGAMYFAAIRYTEGLKG